MSKAIKPLVILTVGIGGLLVGAFFLMGPTPRQSAYSSEEVVCKGNAICLSRLEKNFERCFIEHSVVRPGKGGSKRDLRSDGQEFRSCVRGTDAGPT